MQFTNPIWLWALTGLLIPIGIHLLSRKEGNVIKIGSIRHLEDTSTKQFKSIRLNELLLLALRCLLITMLILLLSGLYFHGLEQKPKWLLVEEGLMNDPEFAFLIDSLSGNGFEFKPLNLDVHDPEVSMGEKANNYWNLVETLNAKSLEQAVILSYNYAEGFNGRRVSLPENIQWIAKNPAPSEYVLSAYRLSNDSVALRVGNSNPNKTTFQDKHALNPDPYLLDPNHSDSIAVESSDTLSIAVVSDQSFEYDQNVIVAALHAIEKNNSHPFIINTLPAANYSPEEKSDWVIWLSDRRRPNLKHNYIYYQKTEFDDQNLFVQERIEGKFGWVLTQRLHEEIAIRENLTVQLARILNQHINEKYKGRAVQLDKRVIPEELAWNSDASTVGDFQTDVSTTDSQHYIVMVFLVVLVAERWVAFIRNQ